MPFTAKSYQLSIGNPAAFQARMPPARWELYPKPCSCAASDAVTERRPDRQANTTSLPGGAGIVAGSNDESGTSTAPGKRSTAVSLGSRTSTSTMRPAFTPSATSCGVKSRTLCPLPGWSAIMPSSRTALCGNNLRQPCGESSENFVRAWRLDGHLGADLDHPIGRNLEIIGGIVGRAGERDEEPVLPAWHARA